MDIVLEEGTGRNVFVGFNLPNQIFQAEGTVSHCHPADGSLVRVEKWGHEGSNPRTRVSLLKDGHVMSLNYHLKSDMDLRREKHEAEEKRKADEAAAAEAPSPNGADTASVEAKTPDPEDARSEIPLAKSVTFNMQFKCGMCMSFTKPRPGTKQQPGTKLEIPSDDEEEGSDPPPSVGSPLMSLMTVSLPTGLVIEYCDKDDNEDYHAIRQTYEKKTLLKHKCEQTQAKVCSEEESRLYLSNGCVVKHLNNGKTVILSPDGGYTVKQVPPPIPAITPALTEEPADPEAEETPKTCIETPPYIAWEVTKCNGEQEHVMSNGETVPLPPLQCYTATDPESKEVMFTRIDSVLSVSRPDGTRIVDHTDGTRITTIDNKDGDTEYKIECVGYATISFHANKSLSSTVFGNGTKIIGEANKTFTIKSQDGSSFQATPHLNRATFTSKPRVEAHMSAADLNTVREKGQLRYSDFGVHQFKLEENLCFEHTDVAGNIFNVTYDGQIATESPDTHVIQHLDHYYKQNKVSGYDEVEREHKPHMRLFMIHSDQTGTEIMDLPKCKAVFDAAATNPDVVKVEEDVENDEFSKAHTFLTPFYQSKGAQWTTEFDEGNIVPNGLVYDGGVKPAAQIMGGWEKRVKSPVIDEPELPPAIHYKQIIEEQPMDDYKRQLVKNGLAAHAKWVVEQELHSQKGSVPDERGEKEKEEAGMLLSRVGVSRPRSGTSEYYYEDTGSVGQTEPEVGLTSEDTPSRMDKRRNTVDSVTRKYSTAVSHNPFKMKMKLKKGIIPQAKWDEIMTEKMEMKMLRSDLRNFRVPNYFDSKFGQAFLASLKDGPDMSSLSDRVPAADISAVTSEKSLDNGPKGESLSTSMILIDGADNMGSNISLTNVGTTPRPGNPTPNVATSGKNELKVSDPKSTPKRASPARDTPLSPHREIPSPNLAKTNNITTPEHDLTSTNFGQSKPNSGTVKSLHIDAKGDIRKTKVMIPRSICGYKPGAEPNTQFLAKEEAVRRGVKTSSVLAAGRRKKIQDMRGFQLYPPEVTFGVLCPNGMYATTVTLKNVGIDSCRFHIKCPKNLLGVTVALHTETNFVAAGMSVKFDVCLSAPNVTEITHVSLDIDIIMEMEVFHLPVLATVLPTEEYDKRSRSGRLTRLPQNIKIIDVSSVVRSNSSGPNSTPYSSDWYSTATFS